jgi:hypothetical protein
MRALATVAIVAGCGYQPGSFGSSIQSFAGQRTTLGCLDLAVERRADLPTGEPVLGYSFGNRCDFPAVVDLATTTVIGRGVDGSRHELPAFDPRHAIEPLRLDGRAVGHEAIAYETDTPMRELCVDAAGIARTETAAWMCVGSDSIAQEVR